MTTQPGDDETNAPIEETSASAPVTVVASSEKYRDPTSYEKQLRRENQALRSRATTAETSLAEKVREAKAEGERLATAARTEADRLVGEARTETERVKAESKAEAERLVAESAAEATRRSGEATTAADRRIIRAEMKAAAVVNGMLHMKGLDMLDVSKVTLSEAGEVVIPETFFADAKAAMPFLFSGTKVETPATTSSTAQVPPSTPATKKKATEMTAAEWKEHRRSISMGARV